MIVLGTDPADKGNSEIVPTAADADAAPMVANDAAEHVTATKNATPPRPIQFLA